jgi:hypothetical protein
VKDPIDDKIQKQLKEISETVGSASDLIKSLTSDYLGNILCEIEMEAKYCNESEGDDETIF